MGLHRHDGIAGIRTAFIKMRQELVERLRARAARAAVLEEEKRLRVGASQEAIELREVLYMDQPGVHSLQCSSRAAYRDCRRLGQALGLWALLNQWGTR